VSRPLPDLHAQRDHVLRDLVELEQQVAAGVITEQAARPLRSAYEAEAAAVLSSIEQAAGTATSDPFSQTRPGRGSASSSTPRRLLYAFGLALIVLAVVLVPRSVVDRPPGGFVTGNEALQPPGGGPAPPSAAAPGPDLSDVTNKELEAVVAANPGVVGMRVALARRYATQGRFDLAVVHYRKALEQEPDNGRAQAGLAWVLLAAGQPAEAARLVDVALDRDPRLVEALWVKANVLLYGLDDPGGALAILDELSRLDDLPAGVGPQLARLRSAAQSQQAKQ
jgi:cytochrome c-type biogenesis protein CcmH/NrfG